MVEQNHQLGIAHLGSKIYDQSMKVVIRASGLSEDQYSLITRDESLLENLKTLTQHYLKKPLQVDLKLEILVDKPQLKLGLHYHELGVTSHLGVPSNSLKEILVKLLD